MDGTAFSKLLTKEIKICPKVKVSYEINIAYTITAYIKCAVEVKFKDLGLLKTCNSSKANEIICKSKI
jgi:predicted DNA repair protein MutK